MSDCVDCGAEYGPPFIWVPEPQWEEMGYKQNDFVCGHCIINSMKKVSFCGYLSFSYSGVSRIEAAAVEITARDTRPMLDMPEGLL